KTYYSPGHGHLVMGFYIPALSCAVRYDRSTGYFNAPALALAMRGLEGLIINNGHMRLLVGCTLNESEVEAIEKGYALRDTVEAMLMRTPLIPPDPAAREALELLSWMIAHGYLEVKVAVPCDASRKPVPSVGIFHAKAGIIEDKTGNRLAFSGSINETAAGWLHNYESFHVFTSWEGGEKHVDAEEREFQALWADKSDHALVLDVPTAKRDELLKFLPESDQPARLRRLEKSTEAPKLDTPKTPVGKATAPEADPRRVVWSFLRLAPRLPNGGERVGEATAAVTPWPHQVRAFERMYRRWPPRLLIADEVGLGKTIEAGMILRQAWLAGRVKRALIMAPKALLGQWQIELREKFNLNWPVYDGARLQWRLSPGLRGPLSKPVEKSSWHHEPFVIVSSHLMRRRDRAQELIQDAEPWDLVVLDEAHHARRRSGGLGADDRPNQLLHLMRDLRRRTQGLILLTATPMQVSPVEVWDLLDLLGLPPEWSVEEFLRYFEVSSKASPSHEEMRNLARLFQATEAAFGPVDLDEAKLLTGLSSDIRVRRLLGALRDNSSIPLKMMSAEERKTILRLLRAITPVRRLISRHTRRLLRRYHEVGKISTPIPRREVEDRFVSLSPQEAEVYGAVEDYITSTYNNAAQERRTAVGFVMTIYRRRLASSFFALAKTLKSRLDNLEPGPPRPHDFTRLDEDLSDDEVQAETMDVETAQELADEALTAEEVGDLAGLLKAVGRLPTDTKAFTLLDSITGVRSEGYEQVMVFTQYTDTMDFLRRYLVKQSSLRVMCFSGRGGEILSGEGRWSLVTRDEIKRRFQERWADVLVCTDAAAEGLNFQFCGALINYDLPWNPMKVEQRIGRIDRMGQLYERVKIVNLHYQNTVETDIYMALRERIRLFETFIGALQPILSRLPGAIKNVALTNRIERDRETAALLDQLSREAEESEHASFDLDAITEGEVEELPRPPAPYGFPELGSILSRSHLLPPGCEASPVGLKDYSYLAPGLDAPVRVTTDPAFFGQHAESVELWSPGSPLFPDVEEIGAEDDGGAEDFYRKIQ
ncbi:MAG: SNF2-related protein, partial [Thermodesulfobacteriota bacterium]